VCVVIAVCSNCCLLNFYVTAIGLSIINKMQRKRKAFRDWDKGLVGRDQALKFLEGRDQALEFLEGREPRLSNFLGLYCNLTISLYFDISSYQLV